MGQIAPVFAPSMIEQQQLERSRKMAEMLQQQGMQDQQGQMVSGHYVAPAATQHLARLAAALGGSYMNQQNDQKQIDLADRTRQSGVDDMNSVMEALQGTPGDPGIPQPADNGVGPFVPPTAAQPGNKQEAMARALNSQSPMVQGIGAQLLAQQLKGSEGVNINGQLVDKFTGQPMGQRIAKEKEDFSMSPGQVRYGADGRPIAEVKDFNKPFNADGTPNAGYQSFEMGKSRAGASNVNNTVSIAGPENKYNGVVGETLAKEGTDLVALAKQAPEVIRNAQAIRSALDNGAITGTGAEARLAVQKVMETAGLVGAGKAANTQDLMSSLGKLTLAGVKTSGLGAGNGFTDKDREFLSSAVSGTIDSTPANLRRVSDISERIARANHAKGADVLKRWKNDPALKAVAQDSTIDEVPADAGHIDSLLKKYGG